MMILLCRISQSLAPDRGGPRTYRASIVPGIFVSSFPLVNIKKGRLSLRQQTLDRQADAAR